METNFNNHIIQIFQFGSTKIIFSETMRNVLIVNCILVILALLARLELKKFTTVPTGFQNFIEAVVDGFSSMADEYLGKVSFFGNWFFTVFAFIFMSNFCGLLALRPPTASLATTFGLASITFILIHFTGIVYGKKHYFKEFLEPFPLFLPVHIMGAIATPLSLSFRLFGNILGATIIMGMVYAMPPYAKVIYPAFLHMFFDLFEAALQALIFVVLSMIFINQKLPLESEHH